MLIIINGIFKLYALYKILVSGSLSVLFNIAQCVLYNVYCIPGVVNLWPAGQTWPFSKKLWSFLNPEDQNIGHQKNLGGLAKKVRVDGPQQKKVPNFSIFWPTFHKRLATPAVYCIGIYYYSVS